MTAREEELIRNVLAAVTSPSVLRALVEAVRAEAEAGDTSVTLIDALDDLDAYCERCDDRGYTTHTVSRPSGWGTPPGHGPDGWGTRITEVPCTCEASRIITEQRRAAR